MLAPMLLPKSAVAARVASTKCVFSRPASARMARLRRSVGSEKSALRVKSPGSTSARLMTISVVPCFTAASTFLLPATTMSPPSTSSAPPAACARATAPGAPRRDADGVDILRALGNAHMTEDRASLLREAGHVDHSNALAFEMGGHAEDAADGDDAGAADTGDDDVVGFCD